MNDIADMENITERAVNGVNVDEREENIADDSDTITFKRTSCDKRTFNTQRYESTFETVHKENKGKYYGIF